MSKPSPASAPLDEAACIFGASVLKKHLRALADETAGVRAGEKDIEYVHRARVASRRLRAAQPLFDSCLPRKKSKLWLKQVRDVTRALGAVRDVDVQIEALQAFLQTSTDQQHKPGLLRLVLRLRQQHQRLQPGLQAAMTRLAESRLVDEMGEHLAGMAERAEKVYPHTPVLYAHSHLAITEHLAALHAYETTLHDPQEVQALHDMRIQAKRLRYTLETFAPLYANQLKPYVQAVRKAQELLGEIHDCDVWVAYLPVFLEEERGRMLDYVGHTRPLKRLLPGLQAFSEERRQAREAQYAAFVAAWDQWQQAGLWEALRKTLQTPLLRPEQLYPPPAVADSDDASVDFRQAA